MTDNTISRRRFIGTVATAGSLLPMAVPAKNAASTFYPKSESQICIFSKHLHWLEIPEMAKAVADMGYDGIDLTVRKDGHIAPEKASEELPKAIAQIRKAGLNVPMIATDIIDPDHPLTEPILKAASASGVRFYRTSYLNYDPSLGVAKSLEKYKKQLEKLAALNKKYNIHGAYQNHAGTRVGAAVWDLWLLLKNIDPQWLGVQYDPKHATAEGGQSWIFDLDLLQNHIRCMDIKDFYWKKDGNVWKHKLVPLGEGMVDFKKYFSLVKQYNISGPMSIHFEYDLGGAEAGNKKISIAKEDVLAAMKRDLQTLQTLLQDAGLS
jgi:sugar phosphate isomerase/epimerase